MLDTSIFAHLKIRLGFGLRLTSAFISASLVCPVRAWSLRASIARSTSRRVYPSNCCMIAYTTITAPSLEWSSKSKYGNPVSGHLLKVMSPSGVVTINAPSFAWLSYATRYFFSNKRREMMFAMPPSSN